MARHIQAKFEREYGHFDIERIRLVRKRTDPGSRPRLIYTFRITGIRGHDGSGRGLSGGVYDWGSHFTAVIK